MTGTWRDRAACSGVDTELFFPLANHRVATSDQRSAQERNAKAWCYRCPVRQDCLDDAIRVKDTWAIRGGLTAREREQPIREHHRAVKRRATHDLVSAISALPAAAWTAIADADPRGHLGPGVSTHAKQALLAAGVAEQHYSAHQQRPRVRLNRVGLALAQHRPVEVSTR